ncbi:MAG: hypothetical protein J2P59_00160 [Acidimicrobiales bacterium]|nr:hypothetical protein [Acidimicrobiales bacterium]
MSAAEVAHRGPSTARLSAGQRAKRDLRRSEPRFALVAGSRSGTAPVIELRPRLRGAARPTKARAVELTLVLSAVAIALTLALLPGPAATGSSGVPSGGPPSCAPAAALCH